MPEDVAVEVRRFFHGIAEQPESVRRDYGQRMDKVRAIVPQLQRIYKEQRDLQAVRENAGKGWGKLFSSMFVGLLILAGSKYVYTEVPNWISQIGWLIVGIPLLIIAWKHIDFYWAWFRLDRLKQRLEDLEYQWIAAGGLPEYFWHYEAVDRHKKDYDNCGLESDDELERLRAQWLTESRRWWWRVCEQMLSRATNPEYPFYVDDTHL